MATPKGVAATVSVLHNTCHVWFFIVRIAGRNPVGVGSGAICPKVAEYGNLGL